MKFDGDKNVASCKKRLIDLTIQKEAENTSFSPLSVVNSGLMVINSGKLDKYRIFLIGIIAPVSGQGTVAHPSVHLLNNHRIPPIFPGLSEMEIFCILCDHSRQQAIINKVLRVSPNGHG